MDQTNKNVAVLIDSENVSAKFVEVVMKESVRFGTLTIKRIYGDWTDTHMNEWKKVLPNYAIAPIQQFKNTVGKNSTDSALIIDAMDILYTMPVDVFVIVSSDSDYTRLAGRLQELGKYVVGIGEKKAPSSLQKSCNEFIFIENLLANKEQIDKETEEETAGNLLNHNNAEGAAEGKPSGKEDGEKIGEEEKKVLYRTILEALYLVDPESEWKNLSRLSNKLRELDPSFTPRNYGYGQLSKMLKQEFPDIFALRTDEDKKNVYIRKKASLLMKKKGKTKIKIKAVPKEQKI